MRKTVRITIEADPVLVFDALKDLGGEAGSIGTRLAGILMTGNVALADKMGLALYGVKIVSARTYEGKR